MLFASPSRQQQILLPEVYRESATAQALSCCTLEKSEMAKVPVINPVEKTAFHINAKSSEEFCSAVRALAVARSVSYYEPYKASE